MAATEDTVLAGALRRVLPGPDQTHLLRAILHRGESARSSWAAFRGSDRDLPALFRTDTGNLKRLSPLLLASIRENGLEADPSLLTVLKTATLREELRADAYRRIARHVYGSLRDAEVPFVVMRGAALMETSYPDPALRHAHDIDLLVPDYAVDSAAATLLEAGLTEAEPLPWEYGRELRHATDTPILVLRRLFRIPFYRGGYREVHSRSRVLTVEDMGPVERPHATDALLLALAHASYCPGRASLMWAVDAWMLIHGDESVDGSALEARSREMRVELPVATMLAYLSEDLGAPVPADLAGRLADGIETTRGMRRDVALSGARRSVGDHPDLEGRAPVPIRHRWIRLRWELFPSREYLAWAYDDPPAAVLPLLYILRPISGLIERVKWGLLRRIRGR